MYIKSVSIKCFRSILDETFEPASLNVFVGNNDIGKSNYLKALNLFFNGQTDSGKSFDFKTDYCNFARKRKGKAYEISIQITFSPPSSYMGGIEVVWRKVWRKYGEHKSGEKIRYIDGSPISGRTKVVAWLNRIKYKYVPAIKGSKYFSDLLCDLHDTLSTTAEKELKTAGRRFISKIRKRTDDISKNLSLKLQLESYIQLPSDLRNLFATLDFETRHGTKLIALSQRGDGIKVRHIPAILSFLAEQGNRNLVQGGVKICTIWGYEEPENNLEMSKAFELASEFIDYSKKIQIFLTTHSPAFYSIGTANIDKQKLVKTFSVVGDGKRLSSVAHLVGPKEAATLDSQMGLLPLITPYIEDALKSKEMSEQKLKQIAEELSDASQPIIYVEGKHDKKLIETAWYKIYPTIRRPFTVEACQSAKYLANFIKNPGLSIFRNAILALWDCDHAGYAQLKGLFGKSGFKKISPVEVRHETRKIYGLVLPELINRKNYTNTQIEDPQFQFLEIEHYFSDDILKKYGLIDKIVDGKVLINDNKKTEFAEKHVSTLAAVEFENFKILFAKVLGTFANSIPDLFKK